MNYEYEKYIGTIETISDMIDKYGVVILPNVLDEEECNHMINDMWNYLETVTKDFDLPINRHDQSSYIGINNLFQSNLKLKLIIKYWSIGHCQMAWNVRQNPKVVNVFAKYWKVDPTELLVSYDSSSINLPPEITGLWSSTTEPFFWYHTDLKYGSSPNNGLLQSWITGMDVNEGDSTLAFIESSNKYRDEFIKEFNLNERSSTLLTNDQINFFLNKGCCEKKIKCPKGSLVLWSQHTVHCGIEPYYNRPQPNIRCITYLCYAPRSFADEKSLEYKREAFKYMYTTTHNPYDINILHKTTEYIEDDLDIHFIDKPKLTPLGLKLCGY